VSRFGTEDESVTKPYVQTRVFRSPYLMVGWAVIVIAVVGTVAFFVGVTWNEFAGTLGDYLDLAKVPLSAVIISAWGLSVARSRVVSTGTELHVINLIGSHSLPWNDVSSFERVDDGSVEVRSASGRAIRLGALSLWRFPRQRREWRATALTELEAILAAHQRED
jgi:energy-converting hydrogenase Eha subunit A